MKKTTDAFEFEPSLPLFLPSDGDIQPELFEVLPDDEKQTDIINRPSVSYWMNARAKLKGDPLAMFGFVVIFLMTLFAILGPMVRPYTYDEQNYSVINQTPGPEHWFGTDKFGRDLFVRVSYGARISLTVGIVAAGVNMVIGVLYGGIAGYLGGGADMMMMRIVDIVAAVPQMLYMIIIMMFLGPNMRSILAALCLTYWLGTARMVRAQVLSIKNQDFVMAARVIGESDLNILVHHLIPNSMGPIIVTVTFLIPQAIFYEAFLSFIGIGISVPVASWGTLVNDSLSNMNMYPHLMLFPSLAISLTIFAFNFIGDGLRDALDPRLKQ
ncbi:MAG: ABC transporter permease [Synergistaceae bacterium]|jgi:oligopeptide transport system permease protein|nr:ABC transporter permease [Synergistaceae bacterium]